jgi:hypothetical protein
LTSYSRARDLLQGGFGCDDDERGDLRQELLSAPAATSAGSSGLGCDDDALQDRRHLKGSTTLEGIDDT